MRHHLPNRRRPLELSRRARGLHILRRIAVPLALACCAAALRAQDASAPQKGGFQIQNASAYFGYYSGGLPSVTLQPELQFRPDAAAGGSIQVGWMRFSERSGAAFSYTSSVTGRVRYSEWDQWNHAFSFNVNSKFAPRWTFIFSANGLLSSQDQALFLPTSLGSLAAAPASFDELSAAILGSRSVTPQVSAAVASTASTDSALRTLLYGQRLFTAGAESTLSYAYSPRLTLSFQGMATRTQHISSGPAETSPGYLIANSTMGGGGVSLSYAVSPTTQVGASTMFSNSSSVLQSAYSATSVASLGRTFANRWVWQIHGGAGFLIPVRQATGLPVLSRAPRPVGGGYIGYKTVSHTLLASFNRSAGDSYGVTASNTDAIVFTWRWKAAGRSWWLESNAAWQRLQGDLVASSSGWRASAGLGRALSSHMVLLTQYAYERYFNQSLSMLGTREQSAVRVTLTWSPRPEFR